jgi:hypothetical protein
MATLRSLNCHHANIITANPADTNATDKKADE